MDKGDMSPFDELLGNRNTTCSLSRNSTIIKPSTGAELKSNQPPKREVGCKTFLAGEIIQELKTSFWSGYRSSMHFIYDPGDLEKRRVDWELERQYEPKHDPEKPPPREHRDKYIFIGAAVGMIVGGILGGILSLFVGFIVTDCVGGIVAGGIVGAITGSIIRTHMLNVE